MALAKIFDEAMGMPIASNISTPVHELMTSQALAGSPTLWRMYGVVTKPNAAVTMLRTQLEPMFFSKPYPSPEGLAHIVTAT